VRVRARAANRTLSRANLTANPGRLAERTGLDAAGDDAAPVPPPPPPIEGWSRTVTSEGFDTYDRPLVGSEVELSCVAKVPLDLDTGEGGEVGREDRVVWTIGCVDKAAAARAAASVAGAKAAEEDDAAQDAPEAEDGAESGATWRRAVDAFLPLMLGYEECTLAGPGGLEVEVKIHEVRKVRELSNGQKARYGNGKPPYPFEGRVARKTTRSTGMDGLLVSWGTIATVQCVLLDDNLDYPLECQWFGLERPRKGYEGKKRRIILGDGAYAEGLEEGLQTLRAGAKCELELSGECVAAPLHYYYTTILLYYYTIAIENPC